MPFYLSLLPLPIDLSLSATDVSSIWSEICGHVSSLTAPPLLQLLGFSAGRNRAGDTLLSPAPLSPGENQLLGRALEDVC